MSYIQPTLSIYGVTGITGGWTGSATNTYGYNTVRVSWLADQDTNLNIEQGPYVSNTTMFNNGYTGTANNSMSVIVPVLSEVTNVNIIFASTPTVLTLETFFFNTMSSLSNIETIQLTSTTGNVVFYNIPQNGTNLILTGNLQSTSATLDGVDIQFNGDAGPNYVWQEIYGTNLVVGGSQGISVTEGRIGPIGLTGATGIQSSFSATISNYTDQNIYKAVLSVAQGYPAGGYYLITTGSIWRNNDPITSITLYSENGADFAINSIFNLQII